MKKTKTSIYFHSSGGRMYGDVLDTCNWLRFEGFEDLADDLDRKSKKAEKGLKQYDEGKVDIDTARIKDFLEREGTEER